MGGLVACGRHSADPSNGGSASLEDPHWQSWVLLCTILCILSVDYGLQIQETTVPNFISLCGTSAYNVTTTPKTSINITFPGTPPFKVHSTIHGIGDAVINCIWHEVNLSSNSLIWTPDASGRGQMPEVQDNETDYQVIISDGDSLVWVARELQGNVTDDDAESKAYVSGNHTVMSPELATQQAANAKNGGLSIAPIFSLKAWALVCSVTLAILGL